MTDNLLNDRQIHQGVLDLIKRAREEYDLSKGLTGEEICRRLGLEISFVPLSLSTDGMLSEKQVIINDNITWQPRRAFTLLHEITHYLLNEDGELYEYFTRVLRKNQKQFDDAIERCCNQGAAEFLMPEDTVRMAIQQQGFSVNIAEDLVASSGASLIAVTIQLAVCAPVDSYCILCAYGQRPKSEISQRTLFAEYVAESCYIRYPLARFALIPKDHLCYSVWQDKEPNRGWSYIPFPSGKRMRCYAQGKMLGERVIALLSLQEPLVQHATQLTLFD